MSDKKVPLFTRAREARARRKMASALASLRTKRSLTLADCARRAKITPYRLERIESGAGHVYLNDLFGLAEAFRLRPSTLIKRLEEAVAPILDTAARRRRGTSAPAAALSFFLGFAGLQAAPARAQLPASAPASSGQKAATLNADGLAAEQAVRNLFAGNFTNVEFERGDLRFSTLLNQYMYAYGRQCSAHLPPNKVEITKSTCAEYQVTSQGGAEINRTCARYETVHTGVYADPALYAASKSKQAVQAQALGAMQEALKMLQPRRGASGPDANATAEQAASDMKALVRMNACDSPGLKRFQDNLRRFAIGEAPQR